LQPAERALAPAASSRAGRFCRREQLVGLWPRRRRFASAMIRHTRRQALRQVLRKFDLRALDLQSRGPLDQEI